MEKQIDLLTIGDACIDLFMRIGDGSAQEENIKGNPEICFIHGSKIPVETFESSIAGNAVNVSVGTQKLGLKTFVYCELGDDLNAEKVITQLNEHGVATDYCIKNAGTPTDVHPIIIYKGERTIFIYHAPRQYKVHKWPAPKWLYYSSIGRHFEKFQEELVNYLKKNPKIGVVFNPGTFHIKAGISSIENFLEISHVLLLNKEEAVSLTGEESLENLHKKLREKGPKLTIITDGKKGSSAWDGHEFVQIPAFKNNLPITDKTGAGDAYSSGLISALYYNKPLKEAMLWGSINSSNVIRKIGAINGLVDKTGMERFVEQK